MTSQNGKRQLPLLPHPDHLRKQAKARLAAMKATEPAAKLADAQRSVAAEYGFDSWAALQTEVMHRTTGALGRRIYRRRSLSRVLKPGSLVPDRIWQQPESGSPQTLLQTGIAVQVSFLIAALLGIGVVCFVLHQAGVPLRAIPAHITAPSELPDK